MVQLGSAVGYAVSCKAGAEVLVGLKAPGEKASGATVNNGRSSMSKPPVQNARDVEQLGTNFGWIIGTLQRSGV